MNNAAVRGTDPPQSLKSGYNVRIGFPYPSFCIHELCSTTGITEEGVAMHSNIPAQRISWTEEPGSLCGHRVKTQLSD